MKVLPVLLEQNINTVIDKLDYIKDKRQAILEETNQENMGLGIYSVYPNFSSLYGVPTTVSPISVFSESYGLFDQPMDIYMNYLATYEDLKEAIPAGNNYDAVPKNWNISLYLPISGYTHFVHSLGKIFKMGVIIFISELSQAKLDEFKQAGCRNFSLLGRHVLHQSEIGEDDVEQLTNIIKNNTDCSFILNTEVEALINNVGNMNNVQICLNKGFWDEKL
jgi:hypothetical protein